MGLFEHGHRETLQTTSDARLRAEPGVLWLSAVEGAQLEAWVRQRTSPHRIVVRSRIVLLASQGLPVAVIARRLHIAPGTVRLWCSRFECGGLAALIREAPGRGRPSGMSSAPAMAVIDAMRQFATDARSVRCVAAHAGTSASTVWRTWRRYGLRPHSGNDELDAARKSIADSESNRTES